MSDTFQDPQDAYARHLLKPVTWLYRKRHLQQSNQSQTEGNSDRFSQPSTDPHGMVLQRLRLERRMAPSALATQACLSVAQLHELEYGAETLFYAPSLRYAAARRVARLLAVEWDDIISGKVKAPPLRATAQPPREGMAQVIALKPGLDLPTRTGTAPLAEHGTTAQTVISGNALLSRPAHVDAGASQADTRAATSAPGTPPDQAAAAHRPTSGRPLLVGLVLAAALATAWVTLGMDIEQTLRGFDSFWQNLGHWLPTRNEDLI